MLDALYQVRAFFQRSSVILMFLLPRFAQSAIVYFLVMYTYNSSSARKDGYSVDLYEWSTVMAVSGVLIADIFTGMCASAWTWWLVFFVFIGIVVVWAFTVSVE